MENYLFNTNKFSRKKLIILDEKTIRLPTFHVLIESFRQSILPYHSSRKNDVKYSSEPPGCSLAKGTDQDTGVQFKGKMGPEQ
jgi:hypothetical protein